MSDPTTARDPRTGLTILTEDECWHRLRSEEIGRVAVSVGSTPDIFPVNYRVHRDEIVIRTEAGTKLAAGTLMSSVAFEVDGFDRERRSGWSVVVKGKGREPVQIEEQMQLDELGLEPWAVARKTRWMVITPIEVTGREIAPRSSP